MRPLDLRDLSDLPVIATATSHRPGRRRWTVMTIYQDRDPLGLGYIAEIVGETTVAGEERRQRRRAFHTLAKALSWSEFDPSSELYCSLRNKAVTAIEKADHLPAGAVLTHGGRFMGVMSGDPSAVVKFTLSADHPMNEQLDRLAPRVADTLRQSVTAVVGGHDRTESFWLAQARHLLAALAMPIERKDEVDDRND